MAETRTDAEIAQNYKAMGDSVDLIQSIVTAKKNADGELMVMQGATDAEKKERVNINVGNTAVSFGVNPTGNRFNLATGSVSVIGWSEIDPNATGTWVPIDPLNP